MVSEKNMCKAIQSLYINSKLTITIQYGCGVVLNRKSVYIFKQCVCILIYKGEGAQVNGAMTLFKIVP